MSVRRGILIALAIALTPALAAGLWLYFWLFHDLPTPDRFGTYIAQQGGSSQYAPVPLSDIPPALRWAAVATEDPTFYDNHPHHIDPESLLRGIVLILQTGGYRKAALVEDGITITQCLVHDLMRASGKTTSDPVRKEMRDLALGILIWQRYTHDEVLEFHLNSAGYGNMVYGAEAAAQYYFGKHVRDLDLAECAMLEAVAVAASGRKDFNPLADPEKVKDFQEVVLRRMVNHGSIDEAEAGRAKEEALIFVR